MTECGGDECAAAAGKVGRSTYLFFRRSQGRGGSPVPAHVSFPTRRSSLLLRTMSYYLWLCLRLEKQRREGKALMLRRRPADNARLNDVNALEIDTQEPEMDKAINRFKFDTRPEGARRQCSLAAMAGTLPPVVHVITAPSCREPPRRNLKGLRCTSTTKTVACQENCELALQSNRRSVSLALLFFHWFAFSCPSQAEAGSIFDKYVKRKRLDPLEAYVPAVILSQSQFKDLEKTLEEAQPKYADCRSLLRSGPAASLRINIRAVAQYAADDGKGKIAFDAVNQCLGALEELDSLLLHASRKDPQATVGSMKKKLAVAVLAIDSLLETVPSVVLDKGKAIADAYNMPSSPSREESGSEYTDPELKQLESLL